MLADITNAEFTAEHKGSHETKDIEAVVDGFNFDLESIYNEPIDMEVLLQWMEEELGMNPAADSTTPNESCSDSSGEPSFMPAIPFEDAIAPFMETPLAPMDYTPLWNDPTSFWPAQEQNNPLSVPPPLLKSSLLDEETVSFGPDLAWSVHESTPLPVSLSPTVPGIAQVSGTTPYSPQPDDAESTASGRKRKGGPNGRSEEELQQLEPAQVKRILSNRASAARSKDRKRRYVGNLEEQSRSLVQQNDQLKLQLHQLEWVLQETTHDVEQSRQQVQVVRKEVTRMALANNELEQRCRERMPFAVMKSTAASNCLSSDLLLPSHELPLPAAVPSLRPLRF